MLHHVLLNMILSSDVLQVHKVCSEHLCNPCFALEILFLGNFIELRDKSVFVEVSQAPQFLAGLNLFFGKFNVPLGWDLVSAGQGQFSISL